MYDSKILTLLAVENILLHTGAKGEPGSSHDDEVLQRIDIMLKEGYTLEPAAESFVQKLRHPSPDAIAKQPS